MSELNTRRIDGILSIITYVDLDLDGPAETICVIENTVARCDKKVRLDEPPSALRLPGVPWKSFFIMDMELDDG